MYGVGLSVGAKENWPSSRTDTVQGTRSLEMILSSAFTSDAGNLVPGDNNHESDVFVTDRQTGATTLVSPAYWGGFVWGFNNEAPDISDNGRYVENVVEVELDYAI